LNLDSNETVRKNKNRPTTIVMNAVTMSNKLQCGNKRNFDVAFLSGENELSRDDRDAKKKSKETEKAEDKLEPMVNSEFFMFTFIIYLKYFRSTKLLTYSLSIDIELKKARSMPVQPAQTLVIAKVIVLQCHSNEIV
jgi:hypothetical protein